MTAAGLDLTPQALAEQLAATRWAPVPYPPWVPTGHIVDPRPQTDKALVGTVHDSRRPEGGRCPSCGATYPRTIPAGQDQRCWSCSLDQDTAAPRQAP